MMITGDAGTTARDYVVRRYLHGNNRLNALSLGCGTGSNEVKWAQTGVFQTIDAYDLSEERIRAAVQAISNSPESTIVRYRSADITRLDLPHHGYDIILFDHSLHHFSPINELFQRVRHTLKPGGLIIANEYIGPSKFQWTDKQLAMVNAMLRIFPKEYLTLFDSRFQRLEARRPSKLAMWLSDPSEAAESSSILPMLEKHFEQVEIKGYGGAILHLLFAGIAHHFINPDSLGQRLLDFCFAVEDMLLECHEIDHDFALMVFRISSDMPAS